MTFLSTIVVAAFSIGALLAVQSQQRSVTVGEGITVSVREAGTGAPVVALHGGPGFNDYLSSAAMLLAVACWSVCFAAVGLAGVWAVLSRRLSPARFAIAYSLAGGLSLLPPYYFPILLTDNFVRSAAVLLGATTIVIGSLLIVRQSGYRLEAGAA